MNRHPPRPEVASAALTISPALLAVIGTLARTYDAQRLRLIERAGYPDLANQAGPAGCFPASAPVRPLTAVEPAVTLDGSPVSASMIDLVTQAQTLAAQGFSVPFQAKDDELMAAEAGWWDALIGDVERRTGLAPRSIRVHVPDLPSVQAIFAERLTT